MSFGAPELRAAEADVRRELEAHLALAAEEGETRGLDAEAARSEAAARFGDFESTVARCRYEKGKDWIVMQRVTWILVLVLLVAVCFQAVQTAAMQRDTREALVTLDWRLAQYLERLPAAAAAPSGSVGSAPLEIEEPREPTEPAEPQSIVIAIGDTLQLVDLDGTTALNLARTVVERDGRALFPDLGWRSVVGLTQPELEALLNEQYKDYYQEVRIFVRVLP